jgi:hypothetical protein
MNLIAECSYRSRRGLVARLRITCGSKRSPNSMSWLANNLSACNDLTFRAGETNG